MPDYGQITDLAIDGRQTTWLVKLDDDGMPRCDFTLIPTDALPGIAPP